MIDAIIKIGGSLYRRDNLPSLVSEWADIARQYRILFVPGGGPFTDTVRDATARFRINDDNAHWMAILGMDQYAHMLSGLTPQSKLVYKPNPAPETMSVWVPSPMLLKLDPLPRSWRVTSDSIAAWVAQHTNTTRLIMLKSATVPYGPLPLSDVIERNLVDPYLPNALSSETSCWLLQGTHPDRLWELLKTGQTKEGTQIIQP